MHCIFGVLSDYDFCSLILGGILAIYGVHHSLSACSLLITTHLSDSVQLFYICCDPAASIPSGRQSESAIYVCCSGIYCVYSVFLDFVMIGGNDCEFSHAAS
jgi:hypothetical protein